MTLTLLDPAPVASGLVQGERTSVLATRLWPAMPSAPGISWLITLGITGLAAALRWPSLGTPHTFVFDETYYAKDAFSLLEFGYERSFVDGANAQILASNGDPSGLMQVFKTDPAFVVHPPVGKWTIAIGEHFFGITPFGWRFSVAVLGTLAVLMTIRITRRLTRSTLIGAIAGVLIAVDGQAIVHSRTALLDPVLMFWILAAFGALLLDRDRTRKRLAWQVHSYTDDIGALRAFGVGHGPRLGLRPWRWVAGICLGLACGTKWSGIWFVVAFGLLTVAWDLSTRRLLGVPHPYWVTALRSVAPALITIVGIAGIVYLLTWSGWMLSQGGYDRQWAANNPTVGWAGAMPDVLRSLWHYHSEALNFHRNLTSPHNYQSNPWGWLLQSRPTSYFYETRNLGQDGCTVDKCSTEVIALGNPIVWWAGVMALIHQVWRWVGRRDWRSGAVVIGFLAGWFPWLFFQQRTIFTFYALVFLPFLVMALAMSLGTVIGPQTASPNRRTIGAALAGAVILAAVAAGWFFDPIWVGKVIPYAQWQLRMWFPTWI